MANLDRYERVRYSSYMEEIISTRACSVLRSPAMVREFNVDQIKKLWILDLIVRSGSLRKAALQARITPSAVSQSLSNLEKTLGRPLLIRDKGQVTPTPEALAVLQVVRPAFDAFDQLRELNQPRAPKMSWLNFGTYESMAIDILPGLLRSLKEKMPNLRLSLRVSRTSNLLTMIRKGELCSAMVAETDEVGKFYRQLVTEDRLGLYVSRKHPIAELGWRAIDEFGVGTLTPGKDGLPRYFSKFLRQIEFDQPLLLSDSFEIIRSAACAGSLVAVLPHRVAERNDDLMEITSYKGRPLRERGVHKIFVVSLKSCDPEETDFLAAEAALLCTR